MPNNEEDVTLTEEEETLLNFPFERETEDSLEDLVWKVGGEETNKALLNFPLDIFLEIISRLSIKPLAICRSVCKTWLTIIYHRRFTDLHHSKAIQKSPHIFNSSTSILFHQRFPYHRSDIHLLDDVHESLSKRVVIDPQFDGLIIPYNKGVCVNPEFDILDLEFDFVGSCNGLLCLTDEDFCDPSYVCNPVIGEYFELPRSEKATDRDIVSGFGYDPIGNVYKVIRMVYDMYDSKAADLRSNFKCEAEIYTLGGSREWRKLGIVPYSLYRWFQVFLNGSLHWLIDKDTNSSENELIVSFDVGTERFSLIPPPIGFVRRYQILRLQVHTAVLQSVRLQLGDVDGYLSLLDNSFDDRCEIWQMKEYGIQRSWTRQYVIPLNGIKGFLYGSEDPEDEGLYPTFFTHLTTLENGIILLATDYFLVCYDPKTESTRIIDVRKGPPSFNAMTHVGSFLSLRDVIGPTKSICSKPSCEYGTWYNFLNPVSIHDYLGPNTLYA